MLHHLLLLLDGGVGTELVMRGVDVRERLDDSDEHDNYWSGKALLGAPAAVLRIHEDYLSAGADVITTNTFRVNRLVVERLGVAEPAEELIGLAVRLARMARASRAPAARIGVSIGPLESWHAPGRAPAKAALLREHSDTMAAAAAAGADLALPETMNSAVEAAAVARVAAAAGLPCIVGYCVREDGCLPNGDSLASAVDAVLPFTPEAVLVNHCEPAVVDAVLPPLRSLLAGTGVRFGARPHLPAATGHAAPDNSVSTYVRHVRRWLEMGASVIGGCCGTRPAHIAAAASLRAALTA